MALEQDLFLEILGRGFSVTPQQVGQCGKEWHHNNDDFYQISKILCKMLFECCQPGQ